MRVFVLKLFFQFNHNHNQELFNCFEITFGIGRLLQKYVFAVVVIPRDLAEYFTLLEPQKSPKIFTVQKRLSTAFLENVRRVVYQLHLKTPIS